MSLTDFPAAIRLLAAGGVEFIVVGGVAAAIHGSAHITYDLHVVYRRSRENIEKLATMLEPVRPYLRGAPQGLPFRLDSAAIARGLNFTLSTFLGALDSWARRPAPAPTRTGSLIPLSAPLTASSFGVFRCPA